MKQQYMRMLEYWQNVEIVGCRFHLKQSWWRKIQELGLSTDYKDNTDIGKWLHYTFGLLFLEPHEVGESYVDDLAPIQPEDSKVRKLADYLIDNYIDEDSKFPPRIWAAASSAMTRTTNACESFHAHFKQSFYSAHPTIFIFVHQLTKFQSEVYVKINSCESLNKNMNASTRRRQEYLKRKLLDYKNGQINRFDFVKIVSHYFDSI